MHHPSRVGVLHYLFPHYGAQNNKGKTMKHKNKYERQMYVILYVLIHKYSVSPSASSSSAAASSSKSSVVLQQESQWKQCLSSNVAVNEANSVRTDILHTHTRTVHRTRTHNISQRMSDWLSFNVPLHRQQRILRWLSANDQLHCYWQPSTYYAH